MYDRVLEVAHAQGFHTARLDDVFAGLSAETFEKPGDRNDITHPNANGHERIARRLAEVAAPLLRPAKASPPK